MSKNDLKKKKRMEGWGGIQMSNFLQIYQKSFRIFCLKFKHPLSLLSKTMVRPAKTSKIMSCFFTIIYFPLYFWVKASGRQGGMTNECSLRRVVCVCFDTLERKKKRNSKETVEISLCATSFSPEDIKSDFNNSGNNDKMI